jgi:hypothetical protein
MNMSAALKNFFDKYITVGFITAQAHAWFAYAVVYTFFSLQAIAWMLGAAMVKEFYIDKHFEANQTFKDNLTDFSEYLAGVVVCCVIHWLRT